jgi:hypothetical protein
MGESGVAVVGANGLFGQWGADFERGGGGRFGGSLGQAGDLEKGTGFGRVICGGKSWERG